MCGFMIDSSYKIIRKRKGIIIVVLNKMKGWLDDLSVVERGENLRDLQVGYKSIVLGFKPKRPKKEDEQETSSEVDD